MQRCSDISTAERCSAAGRQRRALEFQRLGADLRLHCVESSGGFAKLDLLRLKSSDFLAGNRLPRLSQIFGQHGLRRADDSGR